jgi:parallel beta-helix repeat protein
VAAIASLCLVCPSVAAARAGGGPCDRTIGPGHAGAVQWLVEHLRPGQTGCLRHGTYHEDVTIVRDRIHLRSRPGTRARITGRLWIARQSRGAVVSHLRLDGRNARRLPSPTINGDRARFAHVDVTNHHTGICFILGSNGFGRASGTVIRDSRIHDCGRLPATNHDHGIYVAVADHTRILRNVITDNADRGIQLYPDAQRTLIRGNVIAGNGVGIIFSGTGGVSSSHTLVTGNVITGSRIRANVESYYPRGTPPGHDNVVRDNCLAGGHGGRIEGFNRGFAAHGNRYNACGGLLRSVRR